MTDRNILLKFLRNGEYMKIPEKLKGITGDFMYSMMGLIVMNGVIQLALYPFLSKQL